MFLYTLPNTFLGILPFRFMFNHLEIIIFVYNMNKRSNFTFFLWIANCVNFIENSTVSPLDEISPLLSILSTYVWVLSRLSIVSTGLQYPTVVLLSFMICLDVWKNKSSHHIIFNRVLALLILDILSKF